MILSVIDSFLLFILFFFISRISRNLVLDFIAFNGVEFSFFHSIVEFIFLLFVD